MARTTRFDARDLARIAIFAALIVVLGVVSIPLPTGVPVTGQTLGVMLAGIVLGWRKAPFSVLIVLALAAVGFPVLAGGRGGLGVFAGPSAGYLIGWIAGALVIGLIARSGAAKLSAWRVALGAIVGGIGVIYAFGIPVQALVTGVDLGTTIVSSAIFVPGDLIKVVVATILALALQRAYPPAFGAVTRTPVATHS